MEDHWNLESSLLRSLVGSGAETRAGMSLLQCLPSKEIDMTIDSSLTRLQTLASTEAIKLSPQSVQAGLRYVIGQLQSLRTGVAMEMTAEQTSALVRKCLAQFQFFLRLEIPGEEGEEAMVLKGEEAYAQLCAQLTTDLGNRKEIPPQSFDDLQLFLFLAGPLESEAAALIKKIAASESGATAAKRHKKGGAGAATS